MSDNDKTVTISEKEYARLLDCEQAITARGSAEDGALSLLCEIQSMCMGEVTMGYRLDAHYIGQIITSFTGLSCPELRELVEAIERKNKQTY